LQYGVKRNSESFEPVAKESEPSRRRRHHNRRQGLKGAGLAAKARSEMGRRKPPARAAFALFDVFYENGTVRSNRKVPGAALGGLDEDASARAIIEAQDRESVGVRAIPGRESRQCVGSISAALRNAS
jgi:hypothetical protein